MTACFLAFGRVAAEDGDDGKLTRPRTDILYLATGFHGTVGSMLIATNGSGERSIAKAFALSALVPGAGQVYNGSWWKAGVAIAAEAALITAYVTWKNRGNDGVDVYKAYAHANWSPVKYAEWLNAYSGYPGPDIPLPSLTTSDFMHPETWTETERAEVHAFFNEIRAAERQASSLKTGAGFSHVIPYFGEQQYYELIGKYFQFAPGWADYSYEPDAYAETVMPPDAQFYYYAGIHADANDYLRKSSWAGAFVIVNHFVSAAEAAVSAKLHNMSLRTKTAMKTGPFGEPVATTAIVLGF